MEKIVIHDTVNIKILKRLVKLHNETHSLREFIEKVINDYEVGVDKEIQKHKNEEINKKIENPNRSLFSEQTTQRIIGLIEDDSKLEV